MEPKGTLPQARQSVTLSFAGEDRVFVQRVAKTLAAAGVGVRYDAHEAGSLIGIDLYEHLSCVYTSAQLTVIFTSKHYAARLWTSHERRSAQARALREREAFVLPARLDGTLIPGLLPSTGSVDLRGVKPEELADIVRRKLSAISHQACARKDPGALRLPSPRDHLWVVLERLEMRLADDFPFRVSTGIRAFDDLIDGGFSGSVGLVSVVGPSRGVTRDFTFHLAFMAAAARNRVLVLSCGRHQSITERFLAWSAGVALRGVAARQASADNHSRIAWAAAFLSGLPL